MTLSSRIIPARAGFTARRTAIRPGDPDHPRSRGVYFWTSNDIADLPRIIPARAGFTTPASRRTRPVSDHPRSRGVYAGGAGLVHSLMRIIPARAGFTSHASLVIALMPDHPRSRGVYPLAPFKRNSLQGSSPLARGLHHREPRPTPPRWIIPARAGFTRGVSAGAWTRADHPRSRGVYSPAMLPPGCDRGSSPLARGLHFMNNSANISLGIIPARAGFTSPSRSPPAPCRDHPRSRGVYPGASRSQIAYVGSSPLARGLRRSRCSAS